jgi:hypothetical protein
MNTSLVRMTAPPTRRRRSSNVASFVSASNLNVTVAGPENVVAVREDRSALADDRADQRPGLGQLLERPGQ